MRILGIDPGTATTGFGVIDKQDNKVKIVDVGIISTPANLEMAKRLDMIFKEITNLIQQSKPDEVAIELLYFAKNVTTAFSVGQARGVLVLAAAQAGLSVYDYTPLQIKMAVTGYGKANKSQIQLMIKNILTLKTIPKPDDAADALAVALTHAYARKS